MNATQSVPGDIIALRIAHCRAEQAAQAAQYHVAVKHYRCCLEAAELRQDSRAVQFFALKLAGCYDLMHLKSQASHFHALAVAEDVRL